MSEDSGPRKNINYQTDYRPERRASSSSSGATEKANTVKSRKEGQSYKDYYRGDSDKSTSTLTKQALESGRSGAAASSVIAEHGSEADDVSEREGDILATDSVIAEHGSDEGSGSGHCTLPKIIVIIKEVGAKSETGEETEAKEVHYWQTAIQVEGGRGGESRMMHRQKAISVI
jgi:hypothetical protein